MKRILHISDLHFGRIHPPAIKSLEQFLHTQEKSLDLIIVTGDWTQRARRQQFVDAAEFIGKLKVPVLSVPGNHDISLYNFVRRYLNPLNRYNRYIKSRTTSTYVDDELAIIGLTTAHFSRFVEGRLSKHDVLLVKSFFEKATPSAFRVIACHHPFYDPEAAVEMTPLKYVNQILDLKPNLILSGHFHESWIEVASSKSGHQVIHISAGSTISNRLRGEVNSLHILEIGNSEIEVKTYHLTDEGFTFRDANQKIPKF